MFKNHKFKTIHNVNIVLIFGGIQNLLFYKSLPHLITFLVFENVSLSSFYSLLNLRQLCV